MAQQSSKKSKIPPQKRVVRAPVLEKQVCRLAGVDNDDALVVLDGPSERR